LWILGFKVIQRRLSAIASKQSSITLNVCPIFIADSLKPPDGITYAHVIQYPLEAERFIVRFGFAEQLERLNP
jgi:hypothetical protein